MVSKQDQAEFRRRGSCASEFLIIFYREWFGKNLPPGYPGSGRAIVGPATSASPLRPRPGTLSGGPPARSPGRIVSLGNSAGQAGGSAGAPGPREETASRECAGVQDAVAPRFRRLEDFVVGPCNRVAHSAALSLVEEPEQLPSPLVLHGPVGVGKTHLLEGIYSGLRRSRPDWRVWYLAAEEFTNRFVQAIHTGKLSSFRKQFRECDALLIDDLNFLAKKPATQEEFLHTFDALQAEERPVIASCDCHPRLDEQFMPELADRLVGGAVCGLATPEHATRLDLLRHKTLVPDREPMSAEVARFSRQPMACAATCGSWKGP